ncbi:hypothetical protein NFI96_030369, partial [Prochilodus magdalenae]
VQPNCAVQRQAYITPPFSPLGVRLSPRHIVRPSELHILNSIPASSMCQQGALHDLFVVVLQDNVIYSPVAHGKKDTPAEDDVTYSTLVHGKKGKTPPAKVSPDTRHSSGLAVATDAKVTLWQQRDLEHQLLLHSLH